MQSSEASATIDIRANKSAISLAYGNALFLIALSVDLFTPILIWKGLVPASCRWISHAVVLLIIVGCVFWMCLRDYFPGVFLLIMAFSILWGSVAIAQGQGILATIWGWWLFFQFPFVGLFIYLQADLSENIPGYLRKLGVSLLVLEVIVQIAQYLTGELPGDNLAGIFGWHGTATLVMFLIFASCMFFGFWIASRKLASLLLILGLCALSSVLGEMKLFPVAIVAIGLLAILMYSIKYRSFLVWLKYSLILGFIVVSFFYLYNSFMREQSGQTLQQFFTNPRRIGEYLNISIGGYQSGEYYTNMGRNYALKVAWDSIQNDPITLLFGFGLGARSESRSLGTVGIGLASGDLGLSVGTGILVMMQEFGIVGLVFVSVFFIWVILKLIQGIRNSPNTYATEFRYGLLLFTVFWPVWLWYSNVWTMRVPMMLYWAFLGYVFRESDYPKLKHKPTHEEIRNAN